MSPGTSWTSRGIGSQSSGDFMQTSGFGTRVQGMGYADPGDRVVYGVNGGKPVNIGEWMMIGWGPFDFLQTGFRESAVWFVTFFSCQFSKFSRFSMLQMMGVADACHLQIRHINTVQRSRIQAIV